MRIRIISLSPLTLGVLLLGATAAADSGEAQFLAENTAAMDKMMAGMTVKPSGDVDRDFVAMMVPHHQGAIDMAVAELRYGRNEQLRRIAQEIVVEQGQEIAAMHLALGQPLPPAAASPDQPPAAASPDQPPAASSPYQSPTAASPDQVPAPDHDKHMHQEH